MIEIRRYLHEHPELSFQEEQTAQYIAVRADFDALPIHENAYPHHHPKFNMDERSLIISAKAMAAVLASYCQ